jgi:hypothetical protein
MSLSSGLSWRISRSGSKTRRLIINQKKRVGYPARFLKSGKTTAISLIDRFYRSLVI